MSRSSGTSPGNGNPFTTIATIGLAIIALVFGLPVALFKAIRDKWHARREPPADEQ